MSTRTQFATISFCRSIGKRRNHRKWNSSSRERIHDHHVTASAFRKKPLPWNTRGGGGVIAPARIRGKQTSVHQLHKSPDGSPAPQAFGHLPYARLFRPQRWPTTAQPYVGLQGRRRHHCRASLRHLSAKSSGRFRIIWGAPQQAKRCFAGRHPPLPWP